MATPLFTVFLPNNVEKELLWFPTFTKIPFWMKIENCAIFVGFDLTVLVGCFEPSAMTIKVFEDDKP